VHLTLTDLREIPLAAALVEGRHDVIAHTPEWPGAAPASIAYPVRGKRLVVATRGAEQTCSDLLDELLVTLHEACAAATGASALRLRMITASIGLLADSGPPGAGTTDDVVELARAGIAARTSLHVDVDIDGAGAQPVIAPEVVALVLVQLAVNAETHAQAASVAISHHASSFRVSWAGGNGGPSLQTARRRSDRHRWGMGFARIAADALGATVYAPRESTDGTMEATLELGLGRLALPLAAVRDDRVGRATRAWDEETHVIPGALVSASPRLVAVVDAARAAGGAIALVEGWAARAAGPLVWVAVPPDDASARMHDVLDGLVHERALTEGLSLADASRIRALSLVLGVCLGRALPRVPADAWRRRMLTLATAFPSLDVPSFKGLGAMDPDVVALLAAYPGADFEVDGDQMSLRIASARIAEPAVRALLPAGEDRILIA
jgi:hypothetical protein